MVEEKKLRELIDKGIVVTDKQGLRVIDAAKLDGPIRFRQQYLPDPRKEVGKKKPPAPPPPLPEEIPEEVQRKKLLPSELRRLQLLNSQFQKEFIMSDEQVPKGIGLDVGTSFLVTGRFGNDGQVHFKTFRDCFLELTPKSPINKKFIQKGLDDREAPYIEKDDKFFVLGEAAFLMANERHVNTRRPMHRGVLSPSEEEAMPILKEIIKRLVGQPKEKNERLVFSVPGKPIDAEFDQLFHQDVVRSFIKSLGFDAHPMNEAEALAYSELLEEGLTGIAISCGAGMMNVAVLSSGDPVVTFSTSKAGDWIDKQAAIATNMTSGIVQQEKESPELDLMSPDPANQIHQAISVYYGNLIVYTLEQVSYDLSRSPALPKFKDPVPLVVSGGSSLPKGFVQKFEQALGAVNMPIAIREVRQAGDPLNAVANGLTLAASMD
jgi:hypothetical protein